MRGIFIFGKSSVTLDSFPQDRDRSSPKTIPTKRLLYAVALFVSYSTSKSSATVSDISRTRYGDTSGATNGGQNALACRWEDYNSTGGKQRRGEPDNPRVGTLKST